MGSGSTKNFDLYAGLGAAGVAYGTSQKPLYIALIGIAAAYIGQQVLGNISSSSSGMTQQQWDYIILGFGAGTALGREMGKKWLMGAGGAVLGYVMKPSSS